MTAPKAGKDHCAECANYPFCGFGPSFQKQMCPGPMCFEKGEKENLEKKRAKEFFELSKN